jgi:hypothetical protein
VGDGKIRKPKDGWQHTLFTTVWHYYRDGKSLCGAGKIDKPTAIYSFNTPEENVCSICLGKVNPQQEIEYESKTNKSRR